MTKPGANADPKRNHRIDRETTSPSPSKTRLESASNRHHLPTLSFKRQQVQVQPRPRHTQHHGAMQPPRCSSGGSAWRAAWRTSSQPIPEDGRAPERVQGWSVQGALYVGSGTTTKDTDRIEDASREHVRAKLLARAPTDAGRELWQMLSRSIAKLRVPFLLARRKQRRRCSSRRHSRSRSKRRRSNCRQDRLRSGCSSV